METDSVSVKNNVTSKKKLWNLWQGATSNSRGPNQVETISTGHYGTFWSLDGSWKPKVLPRTSQVKWKTSSIVFEITRLWLYIEAYTGKDEHESGHPFKKGSSKYERRQQRCPITKGKIIDKENDSRNYDVRKKNDSEWVWHSQGNQKKQHSRTRDGLSATKGR